MNRPAPLPVLLRTICLAGITAWLAWQLLAVGMEIIETARYVRVLLMLFILLTVLAGALRQLGRVHAPGWRRTDGPVLAFFLLLLLFEGMILRQVPISADRPVNIAPWTLDGVHPTDLPHARALEAAWRERLWRQIDWTPVTWFLLSVDDPPRDVIVYTSLQLEDRRLELQIAEQKNEASEPLLEVLQDRRDSLGDLRLVNDAIEVVSQRFNSASALMPLTPNPQPEGVQQARIDCYRKDRVVQESAVNALREQVFREPQSAISHAALANCVLLMIEQWPETDPALRHEARASANRALVLRPGLADAQMSAAAVAWHFDRNAVRAELLWRQLLETYPNHARIRLELAEMLFTTGLTEAAMQEVQHAQSTAPDHPRALYLRGLEALEQQQPAQAALLLQAAIDLAPESVRFRQALSLAMQRGAENSDSP